MSEVFDCTDVIPPRGERKNGYPFWKLRVGQAFDRPRDQGTTAAGSDRRQINIAAAALKHRKRCGMDRDFLIRCIDPDTVRCKRIK